MTSTETGHRSEPRFRALVRPDRWLPSITAGLVIAVIEITVEISLAALIFSGPLEAFVFLGTGQLLFGAFLISLIVAFTSRYRGAIALPQDGPAVILALVAYALATQMAQADPFDIYITVIATMMLSTLLTGLFFILVGHFQLSKLIRFFPYPVIGGFLAGTGLLLAEGALGVMTDTAFDFIQIAALFASPEMLLRWLPGVAFAILLMVLLRRIQHFMVVPVMLMVAMGAFYLVLWAAGISIDAATEQGWLLGHVPSGNLWHPLSLEALTHVDWGLVFGQLNNVGTILLISIISILLNINGIELTAQRDLDLDHELKVVGVANLAASLAGSAPGYHALSLSVFAHRLNANRRLTGVVVALCCGATLFFGVSLLPFFPKPVLGGLLFFLGLAFLVEWGYDAWFTLSRRDYVLVVVIMLVIGVFGFLEGVGVGLVVAALLFIVDYSRADTVHQALDGTKLQSNVDRPDRERGLLRRSGGTIHILKLQGFIFFGTAHSLYRRVRRRAAAPNEDTLHFVVLDFCRVLGFDSSAEISFVKLLRLANMRDFGVVITGLSPALVGQLNATKLTPQYHDKLVVFSDLDHGLEWCETQILEAQGADLDEAPPPLQDQIEHRFPGEDASSLLAFFEQQWVPEGHTLIQQGAPGGGLYFIAAGEVMVLRHTADGQTIRLRTRKAGTVVGEIGLNLGVPRTASVTASRPSTVFYLSPDALERMERQAPEEAALLYRFLNQLLSEKLTESVDTIEALSQ